MQIKSTMMYHLAPVRTAIISNQQTSVGEDVEERDRLFPVGGMQTGAAAVENSMRSLKKLKMDLPEDPAIPLLGIYLKKPETLI